MTGSDLKSNNEKFIDKAPTCYSYILTICLTIYKNPE